jgi:hypothetical protein
MYLIQVGDEMVDFFTKDKDYINKKFLKEYNKLKKEFPELRRGQLTFNILYDINPDVVDKIDKSLDPFNDDSKTYEFYDKFIEIWKQLTDE